MKNNRLRLTKELEDYLIKNPMTKITLETIADSIDKLAISTGKGFEDLERRMDERFNKVDDRFDGTDRRIDGLEVTMNHRFDEVGSRLTSVERRTTILESSN
jgi:hypothetical protein